MSRASIKKSILPPGPIMAVTLIGLIILSAVLYYRAVRIQRFLEPALAVSQPRSEFAGNIKSLIEREFKGEALRGVGFSMGAIIVDKSLLFNDDDTPKKSADSVLKKLAGVLMSVFKDEKMRSHIGFILVGSRFPLSADRTSTDKMKYRRQQRAESVLRAIYKAETELEMNYGAYFITSAIPMNAPEKKYDRIEFRIIPSEQVHIELLQRLHKYAR